jgi:hypothetical protein
MVLDAFDRSTDIENAAQGSALKLKKDLDARWSFFNRIRFPSLLSKLARVQSWLPFYSCGVGLEGVSSPRVSQGQSAAPSVSLSCLPRLRTEQNVERLGYVSGEAARSRGGH